MADKTYNGWTNYETWVVKLWMDNDEGSWNEWQETTQEIWNETADKTPNQYMDHASNARCQLVERLKSAHDSDSDHPVFAAAEGSVYADLLNAALSEVNWYEIADSLLEEVDKSDEEESIEVEE